MEAMPSPDTVPDRPTQVDDDRARWRGFWIAAAVMVGTMAILIPLFVALYPDDGTGPRDTTPVSVAGPPHIIERPENGRGPQAPGDPGGSQQLALLGMIVLGLAVITVLVWR